MKTASVKETKKIAANLAEKIYITAPRYKRGAVVIALQGDLGAGKTTFTQGFLRAVGIRKKIISPTFVIIKRYAISAEHYKNIYHIDCYRIHQPKELINLKIKEIFHNPQNIILIEWPERLKKHLPKKTIKIKFKYGKKENERVIIIVRSAAKDLYFRI